MLFRSKVIKNETSDLDKRKKIRKIIQVGRKNQLQAENVWNTITKLGLTTGSSQRNYIQQLVEMEERDEEETTLLRGRRWIP